MDFGWLSTVLSALQRRVWIGDLRGTPLFPNSYVILIGPPGVGKGLVLGEVYSMLSYHKEKISDDASRAEAVEAAVHRRLVFPLGPHDCTYERIAHKLAESIRPFRFQNNGTKHVYSHSSMALILEELGSLFKDRKDHGMSKFLLQIFDCKDYDYETQTRGSALVKNPCLSIIAGCTPKFLPQGVQKGILEDGTVSRMLWLFETTPRPTGFFLEQQNEETILGRKLLLDYLLSLSKLFGPVKFDDEAEAFLVKWNLNLTKYQLNFSAKMESYFARIKVHLQKLSIAVHFSEKLDYVITLSDVKTAAKLLASIEKKMDIGFSAAGRNQYAGITKEILQYIAARNGEYVSLADLLSHFSSDLTYEELDKQLMELVLMNKLIQKEGNYAFSSLERD